MSNQGKRRIPGFAFAAMAIGTAFVAACFIIPALGFGHAAPAQGHCYGRGC
jgi:hypothetical protein